MLGIEEYAKMKERGKDCPHGRKAKVGDTRCVNCRFFHIEAGYCSGDAEAVVRHMEILKLGY